MKPSKGFLTFAVILFISGRSEVCTGTVWLFFILEGIPGTCCSNRSSVMAGEEHSRVLRSTHPGCEGGVVQKPRDCGWAGSTRSLLGGAHVLVTGHRSCSCAVSKNAGLPGGVERADKGQTEWFRQQMPLVEVLQSTGIEV